MSDTKLDLWNELAAEVTERDERGRFQPVADAAEKVAARLIGSARKPHLASLVRGYFEVAYALHAEGAADASAEIMLGIAKAHPHLPKLSAETFEAIQQESRSLVGAAFERRAPAFDESAPSGSLKLSSFLDPARRTHRR
jgi:hypothetical protein